MTLEEFIIATHKTGDYFGPRPKIVCNDGFHMSVQGGGGIYSSPRKASDYYIEMEIGYSSEREELIMEFAETPENPTGTVYGYVPIDIIKAVIEKHNGINVKETFNQ
jgi:hypothetical protein